MEEVDAREFLEFCDCHGMFHHVFFFTGAAVVLVFQPKTDTAVCSVLDFEQRHVIVAGHRHFFAFYSQYLDKIIRVVDGSAFRNIEGVGKTIVAAEVLHQSFERNPVFLVELFYLRSHVAHVERLLVGFLRKNAVVRSHEMPAIVDFSWISLARESFGGSKQRVESEFSASLYAGGTRFRVESERHPTGMMPTGIIANGVVENRILPTARRPYAVHEITLIGVALELRHFKTPSGQAVGFAARVVTTSRRGQGLRRG